MSTVELNCLLRCPRCGLTTTVHMPATTRVTEHVCPHCAAVRQTTAQECCVYCAHGSVPCPPMQALGGSDSCCSG